MQIDTPIKRLVAALLVAGLLAYLFLYFAGHHGGSSGAERASGGNPIPEQYAPAPEVTEEVECQTFGRETFCRKLP